MSRAMYTKTEIVVETLLMWGITPARIIAVVIGAGVVGFIRGLL